MRQLRRLGLDKVSQHGIISSSTSCTPEASTACADILLDACPDSVERDIRHIHPELSDARFIRSYIENAYIFKQSPVLHYKTQQERAAVTWHSVIDTNTTDEMTRSKVLDYFASAAKLHPSVRGTVSVMWVISSSGNG